MSIKEKIAQLDDEPIAEWYWHQWEVTDLSGHDLKALADSHTQLLEFARAVTAGDQAVLPETARIITEAEKL